MDADALKKRLDPTHLAESSDELKARVEELERRREGIPEQEILDDPRAQPEYTFELGYVDARGRAWAGKFTTKILNDRERRQVGITRSMLSGGQAYDSLDPLTRDSCLIHAHLAYCLKARPKWAEKLEDLLDPKIAVAIYEEVLGHERFFLDPRGDQGKGAAAG